MAYFRKRGKVWEYRIKYTEYGKQKTVSKSGFPSKIEARLAAGEVERKLVKGGIRSIKIGETLFEDWLEVYSELHNPHRRDSSNNTAQNGQLKLNERFSNYKLNKISRTDYQLFINDLLYKKDYSKNTVDRIHGEMMSILNAAVDHGELDKNNLRGIQIKKVEQQKVMYLNKEQVLQLSNSIRSEKIYKKVMVSVLLRTGIRSGELLGLTWRHIDFEQGNITINQQRSRKGLGPLKTENSYRTITIDNTLQKHLLEYREWQEQNKLNNKYYTESDYVMVDETGKPFYHTKPQDLMMNLLRNAKLTIRKSTHLLRHTHAVMLLEAGVDLKTVSDRLGHGNIKITADTYLHISVNHERKSINLFDSYLKND